MLTKHLTFVLFLIILPVIALANTVSELDFNTDSLYRLWDGKTKQVNGLWGENPKKLQFGQGNRTVVIANLKGPGVITMIHFALPQSMKLDRSLILRIFWDDEKNPSVESPLVDFFCDPNGALERVESVLVNKKRGWNCYFPMPFAKSARVELCCDNTRYPATWSANPCYSYVMYRPLKSVPKDAGYFHACWRQEKLLLGKRDYRVFEADGKGQFIGWNVSVRGVSAPNAGYPVDENVKFFVDGEKEPSIEWQGLEDSFGFSWGFPEQANGFTFTGYQPWLTSGAAAYRFTLNDRISFEKSMRMTVGFGKNEHPSFQNDFSKPENPLEFSSVAYWYQKEPHRRFMPLPDYQHRKPSNLPKPADKSHTPDETVVLHCGNNEGDIGYLKDGWDFVFKRGFTYAGWNTDIYHCWADESSLEFDLLCPKGASGTLILYILDGDNFMGGRKQSVIVCGRKIGEYENFQSGKKLAIPVSSADTAAGCISVVMKNLKPGANAVVSQVRFIASR